MSQRPRLDWRTTRLKRVHCALFKKGPFIFKEVSEHFCPFVFVACS